MRSRALTFGIVVVAILGCGKSVPTDDGTKGKPSDPKLASALEKLEPAELNAQGATFVEPIMGIWTEEFSKQTGGRVKINYQGTGSGAGVKALINKQAAFGCSDAPMTKEQLGKAQEAGGEAIHIPTVIGAVVPMYNLPGIEAPVKFTGPLLAKIFMGKVKKWNDPQIQELNPGVALPNLDVQPVFRADESGTSFIFTDYLSAIDSEFATVVGRTKLPKSQVVVVAKPQSAGVAGHVAANPGTIAYIELTYALDTKAKFGSVRNKAGKDVLADFTSIAAAAEASLGEKPTQEPYSLHDLTYYIANAPGDSSYPIAAMSYAILFKKQAGAKGKAAATFLRWIATPEGQEMAKKRNFVPLPAAILKKIQDKLDTVELQ